uniref:Uncharacterized protein n=1 Tax=Oryza glaberrima TaxID=4538 RepID=I1PIR0_ORYGL
MWFAQTDSKSVFAESVLVRRRRSRGGDRDGVVGDGDGDGEGVAHPDQARGLPPQGLLEGSRRPRHLRHHARRRRRAPRRPPRPDPLRPRQLRRPRRPPLRLLLRAPWRRPGHFWEEADAETLRRCDICSQGW